MNGVQLAGSERAIPADAAVLGRANPRRRARITVHVRPSADASGSARQSSVEELVSRPVQSRAHLSRADFAARFGANDSDFAAVRRFARDNKLMVVPDMVVRETHASQNGHATLELEGSVGALGKAFGVDLLRVRDENGNVYRTYAGPISVASEYAHVIKNVFGLDTRPQARPRLQHLRRHGGFQPDAAGAGYTPGQVAQFYNFPNADGSGQTIAIVELGGGFRRRDLHTYFSRLGIAQPTIKVVSIGRTGNAPDGNPNGDDAEVMLDLEVAACVAPAATFVVYFAPNTNRGFFRAVNAAVNDQRYNPTVISVSWGGPEATWALLDMQSMDEVLQAAALTGVSVFVAAGDAGSSDGLDGSQANVDFPASSPYATACGGTRLDATGTTVTSETVWNDGPGSGTGGGISSVFPPPVYQTGPAINLPASINAGAPAGRGVPDIAGNADPSTGYRVRIDGVDTVVGGTSAVAPLWAGLTARMNQQLGSQIGFVNTLLYSVVAATSGALRDITDGSNDTTGLVGGYEATAGWDACTGLGTPADATAILNALKTP